MQIDTIDFKYKLHNDEKKAEHYADKFTRPFFANNFFVIPIFLCSTRFERHKHSFIDFLSFAIHHKVIREKFSSDGNDDR